MSYRETDEATRLAIELKDARREIERLTEKRREDKRRDEIVYRVDGHVAEWTVVAHIALWLVAIVLAIVALYCDSTAAAAVAGLCIATSVYVFVRALPRRGEP